MRLLCSRLLLLLLTGALAWEAQAQFEPQPMPHPGPIRFYHQNAENLSATRAILQDHEGFMWFGNWNAGGYLERYDGYTYTTFEHDPYDSLSLSPGSVAALFEDREQVLWVGKFGVLDRFDRETETFRRYEHDPEDASSIRTGRVRAIHEDRQGTFWVGTDGGLNRMDRQAGTFTHYLPDSVHTGIFALLEDRQGTLWTGSWGLCRFDPSTGTFTRYLPYPAIANPLPDDPNGYASANWVSALHEDPKGRLWVGTTGGGLYRFDREAETFTNYRHDPSQQLPIADDQVREIVDDPVGGLWVATKREGLVWFDPSTGAMKAYRHDAFDPQSLSGDYVFSLYEDRQGVFWVGTWYRDVDRFDRAARPFTHYYARQSGDGGLFNPDVASLAEGPGGMLWVATGEGWVNPEVVLTRIDQRAGTYQHFRDNPADPSSLGKHRYRVFVDASGTVWIGGGGNVLSRMDPEQPGRFTHFRHNPEDPRSLPPGSIQSLYEDKKGRLWIGTNGFGISRVDDRERGRFTRFPLSEGVGWVNNIVEDSEGMLWVGTLAGLFRLDPATGTSVNYRSEPDDPNSLAGNQIHGIYERPQEPGVLWLGLYPFGLGRFKPATGAFRLYTTKDGLPNNGVQGVLGDDQGRLWMSTDKGIARFDPETEGFTNYDVDDGLQGEAFNNWAFHKGRSGQLYFGGANGLNAFHPDQVRDNPYPPQVVLTTLRLGREAVQPHPDGPLKERLAETAKLTLKHRQNDLTLEYVGLHFRQPEKNKYKYMLEGYDETWGEETLVRQATYTNLPPGAYTFRVKASNSDGVWNEEGRSLAITILPPWWRTWWAYLLYGMLGIVAAAQAYRWQHARIVRREQEKAHHALETAYTQLDASHHQLEETHTHLKATQAQLIQQEKMASLGQLTAGIAHEIKNPLNFVNNFAEVNEELADELREAWHNGDAAVEDLLDDLKQNASVIAQHGKRADGIVQGMMQHASGSRGERQETDLNALVSEYIDLAYHGKCATMPNLEVHIKRDPGADVGKVKLVPQEMGRVLLNLLGNAFDAVHGMEEPIVQVSTRQVNGQVEIRVSDNGPGVPADIRDRIFEPFFTTKPTGQGSTGLGLSLSYDIVTQGHDGTLTVESEPGQGATFVITIPHKALID